MKYAGFWRQAFAVLIDQFIVAFPCLIASQIYFYVAVANGADTTQAQYDSSTVLVVLVLILLVGYHVILSGRSGVTLGRHLLRLKLVRLDQPNRDGVGYGLALGRLLLFIVASGIIRLSSFAGVPLILGVIVDAALGAAVLWLLVDHRRRTLIDRLVGTALVYDRADKFAAFDPDKLPESKVRPFSFGLLVIVNAVVSLFFGLSK